MENQYNSRWIIHHEIDLSFDSTELKCALIYGQVLPPLYGADVLNTYPDVVRRCTFVGTIVVVFGLVGVITSVVFVSVKKMQNVSSCYLMG